MTVGSNSGNNFNGYLDWKRRKAEEADDAIDLKQAMETWKEQMLSGGTALTEEEKEQIKALIANWLEENPLETEEDMAAFSAFVKYLYTTFGAKHDLMDFIAEVVIGSWLEENPTETGKNKDAFLEFINRIKAVLDKADRNAIIGNGTFINFDGNKADPVPSRLFPLQYQLQVNDADA